MFRHHKKVILLIATIGFFLFAQTASAVQILPTPTGILPTPTGSCPGDNSDTGTFYCDKTTGLCKSPSPGAGLECNYSLADFIQVFVNISKIILGILGAVALLFFVYGGITWLTSGGNSKRIDKGKDILVGTIVGMVVVLGAYAIIAFVQNAIGLQWGRLSAGGGGGESVVTGPTGCCIYETTSDEYEAEDRLVTSDDCDRYIRDYTPAGSIRVDWFSTDDIRMCEIYASIRNRGLSIPEDSGCCVPMAGTQPAPCYPATDVGCLSGDNYDPYHQCHTISNCEVAYCIDDSGDCVEGTVVTCMGRETCSL